MTTLPQLDGDGLFVTDGGLETELVFHDGIDLPCFAAFPLLADPDSRARLRRYYDGYLDIARRHAAGFVMETPTWRANPDWAGRLGYSPEQLDGANRAAIALAEEVRAAAVADGITTVVSGCIGPRGDGYDPGSAMTAEEAEAYHRVQIATFADTSADQITAITMTNAEEAIGIVKAAVAAGIPSAISFTVETDGRLPTGQSLHDAIDQVDAATDTGAAYFMVNCAHPTHFSPRARTRGGVAAQDRRSTRELLAEESRRARRGNRTRRGRPARARRSACRAAGPGSRGQGARRLLRHRRPTRGRDRLCVEDELGSCPMSALDAIADWPVPTAAAAVIGPSGVLAEHGDVAHRFATGVGHQAVGRTRRPDRDRGGRARAWTPRRTAGFDGASPAGPHVRATRCTPIEVMSAPGKRRIYSNYGFGVRGGCGGR